jgi:hypothetical protein
VFGDISGNLAKTGERRQYIALSVTNRTGDGCGGVCPTGDEFHMSGKRGAPPQCADN